MSSWRVRVVFADGDDGGVGVGVGAGDDVSVNHLGSSAVRAGFAHVWCRTTHRRCGTSLLAPGSVRQCKLVETIGLNDFPTSAAGGVYCSEM